MLDFISSYDLLPGVINFSMFKNSSSKLAKSSNSLKTPTKSLQKTIKRSFPQSTKKKPKKKFQYKIEHNFFYLPVESKLICIKDLPELKLFCGMYIIVVESLKKGSAVIEVLNQSINYCEKYKKYYSNFYSFLVLS